jgi:hypothetical protein
LKALREIPTKCVIMSFLFSFVVLVYPTIAIKSISLKFHKKKYGFEFDFEKLFLIYPSFRHVAFQLIFI